MSSIDDENGFTYGHKKYQRQKVSLRTKDELSSILTELLYKENSEEVFQLLLFITSLIGLEPERSSGAVLQREIKIGKLLVKLDYRDIRMTDTVEPKSSKGSKKGKKK